MSVCKFIIPWYGPCRKVALDNGFCAEHAKERCWYCKEQATTCCGVSGSLTCGTPECEKHSHAHTHY